MLSRRLKAQYWLTPWIYRRAVLLCMPTIQPWRSLEKSSNRFAFVQLAAACVEPPKTLNPMLMQSVTLALSPNKPLILQETEFSRVWVKRVKENKGFVSHLTVEAAENKQVAVNKERKLSKIPGLTKNDKDVKLLTFEIRLCSNY